MNICSFNRSRLSICSLPLELHFLKFRPFYFRGNDSSSEASDLEQYLSKGGTLTQISQAWFPSKERKYIVFPRATKSEDISKTPKFLTDIDDTIKDVYITLLQELVEFVRNPTAVIEEMTIFEEYLQHHLLPTSREKFSEPVQPQYYFAGTGYFIPGPPPAGYKPLRKNKTIEAMLTHFERKYGINHFSKDGYVNKLKIGSVVFRGFVEIFPVGFFTEKKLFKEDTQFGRMVLHGKNSHRLLFILLCSYIERALIPRNEKMREFFSRPKVGAAQSFEISSANIGKKLYSILMKKHLTPPLEWNLWINLIDSIGDMTYEIQNAEFIENNMKGFEYKSQHKCWIERYFRGDYWSQYSYSSRSPFVFNSLVLCFTQEKYRLFNQIMLDSFWKSMYQISYRLGRCIDSKLKGYQLNVMQELDALYEHSLFHLATERFDPREIISDFIGTIDTSTFQGDKITQKDYVYPESYPNISTPNYESWADYIREKELKLSAPVSMPLH